MFTLLKRKFDESYNSRQIGKIRKDLIESLKKWAWRFRTFK